MIELHIILVLMIVGAVVAMELKDLLSSVIALGAVGFGLTLLFLLLRAPDLAITQLVVEILTVILLIKATINVDMAQKNIRTRPWYLAFAILFFPPFLYFIYRAVANLPRFGSPIMKMGSQYISAGLNKTGAANLVSAIILDFRGYDTLGESTILFASVIGVLAVLRKVKKG